MSFKSTLSDFVPTTKTGTLYFALSIIFWYHNSNYSSKSFFPSGANEFKRDIFYPKSKTKSNTNNKAYASLINEITRSLFLPKPAISNIFRSIIYSLKL